MIGKEVIIWLDQRWYDALNKHLKGETLVKHRNIDRSVVAHFAKKKLLYEDAEYHNAVFIGTDEDGIPRHAHKRSANSYGKASQENEIEV